MDVRLFNHINQHTPKFNPQICNGLAVEHIQHFEQYIHRIFQCAAAGLPPEIKYHGYTRCTPQEEYNIITAKRNNNRKMFEMTRSDLYLVKYQFSYQNPNGGPSEDLKPAPLYLPTVSDGGMIKILGSTFAISPVLTDRSISVGIDSIFIPLTRDKLTFKQLMHGFIVDDERENAYVVWSNIYHSSKRRTAEAGIRKQVDLNATPMHYLLCKYGFSRTFGEFGGAVVQVGKEEINAATYPPEEWRICRSTQIKPKGVKGKFYTPSNLRIAIRREDYNLTTSSMIASFFYIVDHFAERIEPEYLEDTNLWMVLMGYIALEPGTSEGKMLVGIESHITSLDSYIDILVKEWLRENGIYVNDIYELFGEIIETMPALVAQSGISVASMYDKKLTVLRYVAQDIIVAINNFMFALQKKSKKGTKQLSKKDVLDAMHKFLKPELIIMLNRNHGEVSSISSPSDNKLFKITSRIVMQSNLAGKSKSSTKAVMVDPAKFLHASIAEVGSTNNLPKSEPTGRSCVSTYLRLAPDGAIERNPAFMDVIDRVQFNIQR